MSAVENTCRTCGKLSEQEDGSDLYPMFTSTEYHNELKMVQEEFEIWNLNIAQNDGLPQKICLTCFDSFCQIHNFRVICQEAQTNFGELCTGLDIIIKFDPNYGNIDVDFPEDFAGEQTITVQEHYQFPGDEKPKPINNPPIESNAAEQSTENTNDIKIPMMVSQSDESVEDSNAPVPEFKRYQCEFCMDIVSFDDPELLNDHYNVQHSTDQPYTCPKCDKRFDSHRKRNSHARVHFPTIVNCELCGKKVRGGKIMMAQHNELNHVEKDRVCPTCNKKFEKTTLKRFNYHMSWHDDTKLHKCKYCGKKFIQITHLVVHERTHTGENPFHCNDCGIGYQSVILLNNHMKMHGQEDIQCPKCPRKFMHKHGLKLHLLSHDPDRKYPHCGICDKPFRSNINLRVHNYNKHGAAPTPAVLNVIRKRKIKSAFIKPYKCSKCTESFVLHTQLIKHLKIHDEDRPYICNQCDKAFKRESHLKLHINSIHLNKKPHKCTICGWAFSQRNNLREHMAAKHENRKDYKCDVCGRAFAIRKSLKTHKLKHQDRKPFTCTICNKGFRLLGVLKSHINAHLKKNEADVAGGDITDIVL